MSLTLLIAYVVVYYLRLQDWVPLLAGARPVLVLNLLCLFTLLFRKDSLTLQRIFKTPHDWAMYAFCTYMIVFVDNATFVNTAPRIILFMLLTVALDSLRRIKLFMYTWMALMVALAALALLPLIGLDVTDSMGFIDGAMKGRLAINVSLYNNANALGHSMYPAFMLVYYMMFWKGGPLSRMQSLPLFALPLTALYLTFSKGAYICGAVSIACGFLFGRTRSFQITFGVLMLAFGVGIVQSLPRMDELSDIRNDDALYLRVVASQAGLEFMQENRTGIGFMNFKTEFGKQLTDFRRKAAHSSYVQVAAELGRPGLIMFLLLFYVSLKVILFTKTQSDDEERIRRTLFCLIIGYMASSWMVDYFPRNEWVMIAGVAAAYHRIMLRRSQAVPIPEGRVLSTDELDEGIAIAEDKLVKLRTERTLQDAEHEAEARQRALESIPIPPRSVNEPYRFEDEEKEEEAIGPEEDSEDLPKDYNIYDPPIRNSWSRFGWKDAVLVFVMQEAFIWFWQFSIKHMLSL